MGGKTEYKKSRETVPLKAYHEISPAHVHPEGESLFRLKEDDGAWGAVRMPLTQLIHRGSTAHQPIIYLIIHLNLN